MASNALQEEMDEEEAHLEAWEHLWSSKHGKQVSAVGETFPNLGKMQMPGHWLATVAAAERPLNKGVGVRVVRVAVRLETRLDGCLFQPLERLAWPELFEAWTRMSRRSSATPPHGSLDDRRSAPEVSCELCLRPVRQGVARGPAQLPMERTGEA